MHSARDEAESLVGSLILSSIPLTRGWCSSRRLLYASDRRRPDSSTSLTHIGSALSWSQSPAPLASPVISGKPLGSLALNEMNEVSDPRLLKIHLKGDPP